MCRLSFARPHRRHTPFALYCGVRNPESTLIVEGFPSRSSSSAISSSLSRRVGCTTRYFGHTVLLVLREEIAHPEARREHHVLVGFRHLDETFGQAVQCYRLPLARPVADAIALEGAAALGGKRDQGDDRRRNLPRARPGQPGECPPRAMPYWSMMAASSGFSPIFSGVTCSARSLPLNPRNCDRTTFALSFSGTESVLTIRRGALMPRVVVSSARATTTVPVADTARRAVRTRINCIIDTLPSCDGPHQGQDAGRVREEDRSPGRSTEPAIPGVYFFFTSGTCLRADMDIPAAGPAPCCGPGHRHRR